MPALIHRVRTYLLLLLALFLAFALDQVQTHGLVERSSPQLYPSPNERFGFGVPADSDINDYDVGQLHAGWYVDWGVRSQAPRPAGLEYVQIIRLSNEGYRPDQGTLTQIVEDNPGMLWLIGNEPDTCYGQDCVLPNRYAELYHELYYFLKGLDPTCQVAIGGVVQATPLRLQYLDMIWDTYQTLYGEPMPVDVWNVHNFILREEEGGWGCGIPPGISASEGKLRDIDDHNDMDIFEQQIRAFREWMAGHGQRNKPLIVSEYGILFPEELDPDPETNQFGYEGVRDFMLATFDFFWTATDPDTGYPADENRLVQRWAWYSLDDDNFECSDWNPPCTTWSNLFDPTTKEIEALGLDFADYIVDHDLITPYRDLQPITLTLQSTYPPVYEQPMTLTLRSRVVNWGNSSTGPFVVSFWDGESPLGEAYVSDLGPRYEGQTVVETSWTDPVIRPHTFYVLADSEDQVDEWREDNNEATMELDIDLAIGHLHSSVPLIQPGQTADITVTTTISNPGDVILRDITFELQDGISQTITATTIAELEPGDWQDVSLTWPDRPAGTYSVVGVVDPDNLIAESDEGNNKARGTALVAAYQILLPLIGRNGTY